MEGRLDQTRMQPHTPRPVQSSHSPHPSPGPVAVASTGARSPYLPSSSSSGAPARPVVHIIYDYATLPCPAHIPLSRFLAHLLAFASRFGEVAAFTLPILADSRALDATAKQACREHGATIEEIPSNDPSSETFLLTRLLRLTLELQATAATSAGGRPRTSGTSVLILSSHTSLTSSLALMRHSSLFAHIVLIHGDDAPQELISSASSTLTMQEFLAGAQPRVQEDKSNLSAVHTPPVVQQAAATTAASTSSTATNVYSQVPPHLRPPSIATTGVAAGFMPIRRPSQLATSPTEDTGTSLLGIHPAMSPPLSQPHSHSHSLSGSPFTIPGLSSLNPSPSQALLPTPPHQAASSAATSPSVRFLGTHGGVPLSSSPSQRYAKSVKIAASAPSSPTHAQHHHARTFFPASTQHSPSAGGHQALSHSAFFPRAGSERHSPYHAAATSAARTRACLSAYARIIAYCESEKLIPRESVLKKRLVDSKLQLMEVGGGVEFEEFLSTIVAAGVGVVEGEPPQRIMWPRGADGAARHFPCADFFTPVSRLSSDQNAELLEFLYAVQPEVERGRFGFANWLAAHGPPFVRLLAHGVLVELVQLLLNRKVLLFRKGRVSVASRTEANEAASLGLLFSATDFNTPSASRAPSPTLSRAVSPMPISGLNMESAIWDEKPISEDARWRSGSMSHILASGGPPSASHIDRTLMQARANGNTIARPGLNSPLYSQRTITSPYHLSHSSYSVPVTRATSPAPNAFTPSHDALRMRGAELESPHMDKMKSLSSLQPMQHPGMDSLVAAPFESHMSSLQLHVPGEIDFGVGKGSLWSKDDRSSATSSTYPSRRHSLSESENWRSTPSARTAAPFESSTGFVGESIDACDPAAVLAVKLARLNSAHIAQSSASSGNELARFTASVQYRPCFHFEKSGAAHTPEWVCLVAFSIGPLRYQLRSAIHSKKDLAKSEVCMKVLQMMEDSSLSMAPHSDATKEGDVADPVVDLARLLNFLQQAPVVYYLTRTHALTRSDGRMGRRHSSGSISGGSTPMWHGSTRIQVKSVNVLTGEAQPTVSASTPFTHAVTTTTKHEAKQIIATNLLQQIQRARVVNPALLEVLTAARHNLATAVHPTVSQPREDDSILWLQSAPHPAPISAPSSFGGAAIAPPPPVDVTRMPNASTSLFSMHTPVTSHYTSIGLPATRSTSQSVGGDTPPHYPLMSQVSQEISASRVTGGSSQQPQHHHQQQQQQQQEQLPPLTRSLSQALNEEAELTSMASAESALEEPNIDAAYN